jgi:hypothetical protein
MEHLKSVGNWFAATWGIIFAWLVERIPDIEAFEKSITGHLKFLLLIGSGILMWRQLTKRKENGE